MITLSRKICKKCVECLRSLYEAKFVFNHNGLVHPAVHSWDIPQVVRSRITVMSKHSNAKFEFRLDKFFAFA